MINKSCQDWVFELPLSVTWQVNLTQILIFFLLQKMLINKTGFKLLLKFRILRFRLTYTSKLFWSFYELLFFKPWHFLEFQHCSLLYRFFLFKFRLDITIYLLVNFSNSESFIVVLIIYHFIMFFVKVTN